MPRHASAIAFLFCVLCLGCRAQEQEKDVQRWLRDGKLAFRLPDLAGNMVSSEDQRFKNKVVLLDVWGTWCPPCREMTPFLKDLHARFASEGLEIVGVAFQLPAEEGEEDPESVVSEYIAHNDVPYLNLFAGTAEHPSTLVFTKLPLLQFDGFPTVVIVARDGTVKLIEEGFDGAKARRMEALVRDLLG